MVLAEDEYEDCTSIVESLGKPIERNCLGPEIVDSVIFCNHEKNTLMRPVELSFGFAQSVKKILGMHKPKILTAVSETKIL